METNNETKALDLTIVIAEELQELKNELYEIQIACGNESQEYAECCLDIENKDKELSAQVKVLKEF